MTITREQLDELERKARAATSGCPVTASDWAYVNAMTTDVTLRLVAIARAALAFVQSDDEDRVKEFDALVAALGVEP